MDSSFFSLRLFATAIGFFTIFSTLSFMVYNKIRSEPHMKDMEPVEETNQSPPSYWFDLSSDCSYHVYASYSAEDVQRSFLSHVMKELGSMGIRPFMDHGIERSRSIGPELTQAIRVSRVAVVVLSTNYASSSWCLDELVEIMKCRQELGQVVLPVYYDLDPSAVRKKTGDFWTIFGETCKGKTEEEIRRWSQALARVTMIVGYDSRTWDSESVMIEYMSTYIWEKLDRGLYGMEHYFGNVVEPMEVNMASSSHPFTFRSYSPPSLKSPSWKSPNWKYDVYSSFHGGDVRRSLLSYIVTESKRKAIDLFVVNNIEGSKSIGPVIVEAIRESRISIVLLSKNYPSSTWCLDELVEIIKCREELHQTVMVLFYEVDPTDVKNQTGDFGKVFRETCRGKTEDNIRRWKHALAEVAQIAGYYSKNWGNEAVMIDHIVSEMSNILDTSPSYFEGLVGMEDHMENMEHMLCLDSDEVKMIGISGPRGIGKTTIAKCLYQQFSHQFELSTIVANIKECHNEHNATSQLQIQLFSQLSNQKETDENFLLGVAQEMLKDKKVFVILDDVDGLGQLDALAQEVRCFGPGSRIIFITHDHRCLKAYGIDRIYEVDYPLPDEALQIFCIYAFGQKIPYDGFMELAQEVTTLSGRLPKGLWFMGSYLCGMSKQCWKNELPRLRSSLDGDLESILRFSSESLWGQEKQLAHYIGGTSFSNGDCNEAVEEYSEMSFSDVRQELIITNQDLMDLNTSVRAFEDISSGYLRWKSFPMTCWPSTLHPENLVELYMPDNKFVKLWEGIRHLGKLTLMDLSSSKNLRQLPDLSTAINLKSLDLKYCSSLVELPYSIGNAISLLVLNLEYCSNLVDIPSSIGSTTNLRKLLLTGCSNLVELPSSLGNATNLRELSLGCCSNLKELPSSIEDATNLERLNLEHCSRLVKLPSSIGNAINLKELNLTGCSSLVELPWSIGNATNLEILDLRNCSGLAKLPDSIGNATNLWELDLDSCTSLVELPSSIGNATNLRKLNLSNCSSLVKLPSSIGNATNLEYLYLSSCSSLLHLPSSIGCCTSLQHLYLNNCSNLLEVPASIGNVANLKKLDLSWCTSLVELPDSIRNSTSIWQLNLDNCSSLLEGPSSTGKGVRLTKLDLSWCTNLVQEIPMEIPSSSSSEIRYSTF